MSIIYIGILLGEFAKAGKRGGDGVEVLNLRSVARLGEPGHSPAGFGDVDEGLIDRVFARLCWRNQWRLRLRMSRSKSLETN